MLAALAALALVAGACSAGGDGAVRDEAVERPPGTEADAADAGRVDRLTVAVPLDHGPLNIFAQHEEPLTELVYDKLLAPSPYVEEPQPWLATAVTPRDPSTWEVELRDDVTWHDGEEFTAEDVAFTVDYFKASPTGRWTHHVSEIPEIDRVEVVDETTAVFHCAFPCPFLGSVMLADLPMIPEHVWADVEDPALHEGLPVGTGPYRLTAYEPSTQYRFEANEDYFAGPPRVRELVMPIITDPSTAFTALRSGELDAVDRLVPPELLEQFEASEDIEVVTTSPLGFPELRMNFEVPPFDQPAFRRALSKAVDREQLLETVALGQGRPATQGYMHPDTPWSAPDVGDEHDPGAARALLEEAGFTDGDGDGIREDADGEPLGFTIKVAGTEPTDVRAAELLAEQFGAVGLDVSVESLDPGTIGDLFSSRDFETYVNTIGAHGTADPTQFIMSHRSGYLWDLPEVPYPEMAALIDDWKAATTIEDRTERLFEMQRLFARQPTTIPLYYPDGHRAYRSGTYDGWAESPAYGIVHKWSLLPREIACQARALVASAC